MNQEPQCEKESLLAQLRTIGTYPAGNTLKKWIKDVDVRRTMVERWKHGLERRLVLDPGHPKVYRLRIFFDLEDQIRIQYVRPDAFGCSVWDRVVPEDVLCHGSAWRDLRHHERNQTPAHPTHEEPYTDMPDDYERREN